MEDLRKDQNAVLGVEGTAVWLVTPNAALGGWAPESVSLEELKLLVGALLDGAYL